MRSLTLARLAILAAPIVLLASSRPLHGQAAENKGQQARFPPEVQRLYAAIDRWRAGPGIRAELSATTTVGPQQDAELKCLEGHTFRPKETFIARRKMYRFSYVGETVVLSRDGKSARYIPTAKEAAYDGEHFQFFVKEFSVLLYSKANRRNYLEGFEPLLFLQPFQFLSARSADEIGDALLWSDLFDNKQVLERLRRGTVGSEKTTSGVRPTVTFPGGKYEGRPVVYRAYVDGPDGQPAELDYVDDTGKVRIRRTFKYTKPDSGAGWWIPTHVDSHSYDPDGTLVLTSTGDATRVEFAPKLAPDAFSIDLLLANRVTDLDAKKQLSVPDWEKAGGKPPPSIENPPAGPPTSAKPAAPTPRNDDSDKPGKGK